MKTVIPLLVLGFAFSSAAFGWGAARGGGARYTSRTTVHPGGGVTHTTTAGYHHYGGVGYPGRAPGYAPRAVVAGTAARVAYRTAVGTAYYYGAPVYAVPAGCSTVYWEGMMVQNCGGVNYVYQNSAYYPIEY